VTWADRSYFLLLPAFHHFSGPQENRRCCTTDLQNDIGGPIMQDCHARHEMFTTMKIQTTVTNISEDHNASETSVSYHITTRCHNPEDYNVNKTIIFIH
jgi:predicted secreted Zn-dependent protease